MYKGSYHNTNNMAGAQLAQAERANRRQEDKVLELFEQNPSTEYTRDEVWKQVFEPDEKLRHAPPGSAGRALTNLLTEKRLVKTTTTRPAVIYGNRPQHTYKLRTEPVQGKLFEA